MRGGAARAAVLVLWATLLLVGLAGPLAAAATSPSTSTSDSPLSSVVVRHLGAGLSEVSQGALSANSVATSSPNPTASVGALSQLSTSGSITTYQRTWQDTGGDNQVQDLLLHFTTTSEARAFFTAVRHALLSGQIVSSTALPGIPGAIRTTYFATTTTQLGVGQSLVMQAGPYVATLSFFSAHASSNTRPLSLSAARTIALDQYADLLRPPGSNGGVTIKTQSGSSLGWILLGVGIALFVVLAGLVLWWRRRTAPFAPTGSSASSSPDPVPAATPAPEPTAPTAPPALTAAAPTEPQANAAPQATPRPAEDASSIETSQPEPTRAAPEVEPDGSPDDNSTGLPSWVVPVAAALGVAVVVWWLLRRRSNR